MNGCSVPLFGEGVGRNDAAIACDFADSGLDAGHSGTVAYTVYFRIDVIEIRRRNVEQAIGSGGHVFRTGKSGWPNIPLV